MQSHNGQKGFTLVELSIVIVIIGLIIAGVTAGQTLVKQAQLRSILTQADQIRSSVNAFKLQYNNFPGDINNASTYWSTGCNAAGTGASVAAECDGDGNKQIKMNAGDNTDEGYEAWLHLSKANLFPGAFVPGTAVTGTINTNIPASKYTGAGMTIGYDTSTNLGANAPAIGKNVILFGAQVSSAIASGPFLSAPQASSLDTKADDGNPLKGSIVGNGTGTATGSTGCRDTTTGNTYNLSSTTAMPCALEFVL